MLVHGGFAQWTCGKDPDQQPTGDEVLDDLSRHWLTNTAVSAARGGHLAAWEEPPPI